MLIQTLKIENFRNLKQVELNADPSLNVLYGSNGAGKTSVLESLVVLSRGRSFRTTQAGELIGPEMGTFRIFSKALDHRGKQQRIGLERSGKRWRGRKNGQDLSQLSQLTRSLPLVLMEPDSHLLISGAPEVRRKYLDWGLFHVEHGFLDAWRRYSKALKQRNAALRSRQTAVLDSLDSVLVEEGGALDAFRTKYVKTLAVTLPVLVAEMSAGLKKIKVEYSKGWREETYLESLNKNRERDLERGATHTGPHRADMLFQSGNSRARAVLSRGEQKLLAAALLLSQAEIVAAAGDTPILLFDDLSSEFDTIHFEKVLQRALGMGGQVWLTGTGLPKIHSVHKVFHVEQGAVQEML